ncbi:serine O-acetyltransferase [Sphingomonas naphthae]|uniref:Serine O-acetyltransferase n=1 Tax=Sphingomonas naphthae TaxID=1813468 RepID=A0ABY7TGC2_9SPHN|nr:serine O-acetyltransferase EpsC [Sphingomonas naphthae]WCT71876.1 serine O-acetyltransferase [Sphingomonas naphthae]
MIGTVSQAGGAQGATDDRIAFPDEIDAVVDRLQAARGAWRESHDRHAERGVHFPSRQSLKRIARELGVALFPLRLGPPQLTPGNENASVAATLESTLSRLAAQIGLEFQYADEAGDGRAIATRANAVIGRFAGRLPAIRRALDEDVAAAYANDPAARSVDEVLIAYTPFAAILHHRIAHVLHELGAPLVARIVGEIAHAGTGVDIHPATRIGRALFIDHGTGVVIGETAILGDRVRLYQGVTLGGDPDLAERKGSGPRHPIVGDDVVIHVNTSIVGRVTTGDRARIGGSVWLRQDVPADSLVELAAPRITPLPRDAG